MTAQTFTIGSFGATLQEFAQEVNAISYDQRFPLFKSRRDLDAAKKALFFLNQLNESFPEELKKSFASDELSKRADDVIQFIESAEPDQRDMVYYSLVEFAERAFVGRGFALTPDNLLRHNSLLRHSDTTVALCGITMAKLVQSNASAGLSTSTMVPFFEQTEVYTFQYDSYWAPAFLNVPNTKPVKEMRLKAIGYLGGIFMQVGWIRSRKSGWNSEPEFARIDEEIYQGVLTLINSLTGASPLQSGSESD